MDIKTAISKAFAATCKPSFLLVMLFASGHWAPAAAADVDFYKGKRVSVYIGYGPAGGYDQSARFLARHMGRFIPGNPTLIPINRPGAGSITLANELYMASPRDGTAIGIIGDILLTKQILGEPGVTFVAAKFNWIGRLRMNDSILVVRQDSGVSSIEDARTKSVIIGVPGAGSATALELTVMNQVLGTKFNVISGYNSGSDLKIAMERGEVSGSGSLSWRIDGEWIRQNGFRVILQKTPLSEAALPNVPLFIDKARNEDEQQLLRLFTSHATMGRSFLAPPEVPAERVRILRDALKSMIEDPGVRAEADKLPGMELDYLSGEEQQRFVELTSDLSPRLRQRALEVSGIN